MWTIFGEGAFVLINTGAFTIPKVDFLPNPLVFSVSSLSFAIPGIFESLGSISPPVFSCCEGRSEYMWLEGEPRTLSASLPIFLFPILSHSPILSSAMSLPIPETLCDSLGCELAFFPERSWLLSAYKHFCPRFLPLSFSCFLWVKKILCYNFMRVSRGNGDKHVCSISHVQPQV